MPVHSTAVVATALAATALAYTAAAEDAVEFEHTAAGLAMDWKDC